MAALSVQKLQKSFGGLRVTDAVDLPGIDAVHRHHDHLLAGELPRHQHGLDFVSEHLPGLHIGLKLVHLVLKGAVLGDLHVGLVPNLVHKAGLHHGGPHYHPQGERQEHRHDRHQVIPEGDQWVSRNTSCRTDST